MQQVGVLRDLISQLQPQLERAAIRIADLRGEIAGDRHAIKRPRERHPEPRLGRVRGCKPLPDRDRLGIRRVGRGSIGSIVQVAQPVPDLRLLLQRFHIARPRGERLVVELNRPTQRNASLCLLAQVGEDLPHPKLRRGEVGENARVIALPPQKLFVERFSFLPADIVSQILNFGLPAPIDVQVVGNNQAANYAYATELLKRIRTVAGIADPRIQQVFNYPQINVEVDRTLAGVVGLTQRDVANSLLVTLSGSQQVHPNFWLNPENGVSYPLVAQMPQYRIDTMSDLANVPVTSAETKEPQYLGGLAQITPGPSAGVVSHYNVQPVVDIYGAIQQRDLGAVAADVDQILQDTRKDVPRGSYVVLRGQVQTMTNAYSQLYFGLAGAILLIYLVIVVNFQSWLDPFIIITALPAALARHRLDVVHNGNNTVRTGADRRHHVHGDRDRKLHPACELRA